MEGDRDSRDLTRVSRRGFMKGVGTGLVGSALLGAAADPEQPVEAATADGKIGPGVVSLTLNINDRNHPVRAEPRATLANVLRNDLELTGTKIVCDRGSCGGCTVLLDGKPVYSCMMLAVDAMGKKIKTVEGLTPASGELDPVQAAFVEKDALMCGFCTPGFVVSVRSLLNTNKNPTLEEVKAACSGNICRCGTYPRIFEAAMAAAERTRNGE
jgi:aerobic-type carbon monoxide dehydrogenase small subunit (CoxS/CutS family)